MIAAIKALAQKFDVKCPPDEKLMNMSLKQLESTQRVVLGMSSKTITGTGIEKGVLVATVNITERILGYLGVNMTTPVSLSQLVARDPQIDLALERISILNQFSPTLRKNPYYGFSYALGSAAVLTWLANSQSASPIGGFVQSAVSVVAPQAIEAPTSSFVTKQA